MKYFIILQVPDYYDIIKKPIALNIIREKVNKCEYKLACEWFIISFLVLLRVVAIFILSKWYTLV